MPTGIGTTFLSAFQASISVVLTIFYGVIAAQLNLLSETAGRDISKTCIRMLMPALLIANVGSEFRLETAMRYVPILGKLNLNHVQTKC
jgi:predicted permease